MREIDAYFHTAEEPAKSCLLALRQIILGLDANVTEVWRYRMPFYLYNGKRFCYLWIQKKTGLPYVGIVDGKLVHHPSLIRGDRSRMKILLLDPRKDIPVGTLRSVLNTSTTSQAEPVT